LIVGIVSLHLVLRGTAPVFDMRIPKTTSVGTHTTRAYHRARKTKSRHPRKFREMTLCVTEDHVTEAARSCPHI